MRKKFHNINFDVGENIFEIVAGVIFFLSGIAMLIMVYYTPSVGWSICQYVVGGILVWLSVQLIICSIAPKAEILAIFLSLVLLVIFTIVANRVAAEIKPYDRAAAMEETKEVESELENPITIGQTIYWIDENTGAVYIITNMNTNTMVPAYDSNGDILRKTDILTMLRKEQKK